jgi:glycosyltransferase involved in cell wall biosynthesis
LNSASKIITPSLSIVVIGRNEGQRLRDCLQSLRLIRNIGENIETIYVDSGSTDGSPQAAAELGAEVVVLNATRPTAALGRNAGWERARAEFILFLDGDTILHPDFPRRALDSLASDPKIAAVWGHRREIDPQGSLYNRILDLDWVFPTGDSPFCGGDVVMRREVLEAVGGYDGNLIAGEEPELCRRMRAQGFSILHLDAPMTGHDLQMKHFRQYWKRALRAGHAYAEVSARFRGTSDPFWQAERKGNLRRGGFWLISFFLAVVATILLRSFLPALAWISLLLLLSLRSAWNARWKSRNVATLLAYGVHSQLQQIPIFLGQLQFDRDRRRGRQRKLIEYKGSSCQT